MAKPAKRIGLYAGSFDPITLGHLDIVDKALSLFDHVQIGVGVNPKKTGLYQPADRVDLIKGALDEVYSDHYRREPLKRLGVGFYPGSMIAYAREIGATHIVRGLRQVSDFNDEFALQGVLRKIAPDIPVVHIICDVQFLHVSSSTVRELASLNADVNWLVTRNVRLSLAGLTW
jgi:pantetheine-phosphate adenylyltransferase